MSMSWKKYGGTNKLDRMNNMNVNNLTTDAFSIQNPYLGDFDICGNLYSYNVFAGNITAYNDLTVNGALNAAQLEVANLNVNTDSIINGNLNVVGRLTFDTSGTLLKSYFSSNGDKLGLNTPTPTATLDIHGNATTILSVFSERDYTRNIIVQNVRERGIAVETDSSSSAIVFYNDASMNPNTNAYSARIQYKKPGTLTINVDETTNILSKVVVSNRTDLSNILSGALTVYDVSSGIYQQSIYKNASAKVGQSLTMVANDVSSITMMHMMTPNRKGLVVAAGAYPNDQSRSMTTFGWMDTRGTSNVAPAIIPSQMIVSGNNGSKYMSTIGINTYAPRTEKYVLDINGPIHVANGQLRVAQNVPFEIKQVSRTNAIRDKLVAVGSPSTTAYPYLQNIYYSQDAGQSWSIISVGNNTDIITSPTPILFNGIYAYDNSFSVLAGEGGYMFYTVNSGQSWSQISITQNIIFNAVYIDQSFINLIGNANMYYFPNPYPASLTIPPATLIDVPMPVFSNNSPARSICGNGIYIYVAGTQYILVYNQTRTLVNSHSVISKTYFSIYCIGPNVIAVGNDIISYSKDNGTTWSNVSPGVNLKSVFILDNNRAIAAGDSGALLFTQDGYLTWSPIPANILRVSGNSGILTDASNQFISIQMSDPDTLVLSATRTTYSVPSSRTGNSYLFYCFLPSLFNAQNNLVLDLCGNMLVSGNVDVQDGVFVSGNSRIATMTIQPYNVDVSGNVSVDNLSVRANAQIQYLTVGNITIKSNATVDSNITINGNAILNNICRITNTTQATNSTSGALLVAGGVGVGANLYVGGNVSVSEETTLNGITRVSNTTQSNNSTSGALLVAGGVGVSANLYVGGNVSVSEETTLNGITRVSNTTQSTNSTSGALLVAGGVGVRANLCVGGNVSVSEETTLNGIARVSNTTQSNDSTSGALLVAGGVGVGANLYVGGNVSVSEETTLNGITRISNTTQSTNSTSGALLVAGGVGVRANLYVGGNVSVSEETTLSGITRVSNTTQSTNSTSGALLVSGGVGVRANLYVGGNVSVSEETTLNGITRISNTTQSNDSTSGALLITGGVGVGANLSVGGNLNVSSDGRVIIYNTDYGTTYGQGALIVSGGGSFGGNVNVMGNVNVGANILVEGLVVFSGDTYIDKNTESTSTSTGSLVVLGGVGISSNIFIGGNSTIYGKTLLYSTEGSQSSTTGALQLSGGAGISGNIYVGGILVSSNTSAATSTSTGSLRVLGGAGVAGNLYVGHGQASGSTTTGTLVVSGGVGVSANIHVGGGLIVANSLASTSTSTGSLLVSGGAGIAGNLYVGHEQESISTSTGTLVVSGGVGIRANTYVGGNLVISSSVGSTNSTTGALQVLAGAGIGGNAYVGGVLVSANTTASTSTSTGALQVLGGAGVAGNLYVGHGQESVSTSSGTLVVSGGAGIRANAYIGGNMVIGGNVRIYPRIWADASSVSYTGILITPTNLAGGIVNGLDQSVSLGMNTPHFGTRNTTVAGGLLRINTSSSTNFLSVDTYRTGATDASTNVFFIGTDGTTNITGGSGATNTTSGILRVSGGVGITGNTYIGGQTVVRNNGVSLGSSTTGALLVDGGVGVGGNIFVDGMIRTRNNLHNKQIVLYDTSANEDPSGGTNFYGFGVNNNTLRYQVEAANGIHRFYSGTNDGTVVAGNLLLNNNNPSTDTATGGLRVVGGAGIGGNLFVGNGQESISTSTGTVVVSGGIGIRANAYVGGNLVMSSSVGSRSTATGALQIVGGAGIGGNAYVGGFLVSANTTPSTSTSTGSLQVLGGVGVAGNIHVGGGIVVANSLASTSTSTGSLVVSGGVGIGGNLYVGGITVLRNTEASLDSATTGGLQTLGGAGIGGNLYINDQLRMRSGNYLNKKIILHDGNFSENIVNGNTFYGFGVQTNEMKYHCIGGATHKFYTGSNDGNLNAGVLTLTSTIDSTNTGALQVAGGSAFAGNVYAASLIRSANSIHNKKIVLWDDNLNESVAGATSFYGFGINENTLRYQTSANFASHRFYSGTENGAIIAGGLQLLNTTTTGLSPSVGALVVSGGAAINGNIYVNSMVRTHNSLHNKKIVIFDNNENEVPTDATNFYGFGVKTGILRYQTMDTSGVHRFYSGTSDGNLIAGVMQLTANTISNSTSVGALTVAGGIGVGGQVSADSFMGKIDVNTDLPSTDVDKYFMFGDSHGIPFKIYSGYFANNTNYFLTATPLRVRGQSGGNSPNLSTIANATNGQILATDVSQVSLEWYGLFYVSPDLFGEQFTNPSRARIQFRMGSVDSSIMWFGSNAVSGYTLNNETIDNSGTHSFREVDSTVQTVNRGEYFPIRIQYGYNGGSGPISFYLKVRNNYDTAGYADYLPGLFFPASGNPKFTPFSNLQLAYNPAKQRFTAGNIAINSNASSFTATTGALTVAGGVGITGNLNVGNGVDISGSTSIRGNVLFYDTSSPYTKSTTLGKSGDDFVVQGINANSTFEIVNNNSSGTTYINSLFSNATTSVSTGEFYMYPETGIINTNNSLFRMTHTSGTCYLQTGFVGNTTFAPFRITAKNSTSTVLGIDAQRSVHIGTDTPTAGALLTVASTGNVSILSMADSVSSTNEGALRVAGGVGIGGNVFVNNMVRFNNVYNNKKLVLYDSSPTESPSTGTDFYGLGVNLNTLRYQSVAGATHRFYTGTEDGNLIAGALELRNMTASSSQTTGALIVAGGVGIAGNLNVGGNIRISGTQPITMFPRQPTNTLSTTVNGIMMLNNNPYSAGMVLEQTTFGNILSYGINVPQTGTRTDSIAGGIFRFDTRGGTSNPLFQIVTYKSGGSTEAIPLQINEDGIVGVNTTTMSTSTATGALVVAGGVGIGGNLNVRGAGVYTTTIARGNPILDLNSPNKRLRLFGDLSATSFNGMVNDGDTAIIAGSLADNGVLYLGTWSSTPSGIRITNNAVSINPGLTVVGTVNATTFNATSDYRIKSNIVPLQITDYSIDKLKPVYYYNTLIGKNDIGFIAHEVQEEYPFLVSGEKDSETNQSLNYLGIVGILVKEVQDLKKANAELKKANAELVASNAELKKANAELVASNAELKRNMTELRELVMSKMTLTE